MTITEFLQARITEDEAAGARTQDWYAPDGAWLGTCVAGDRISLPTTEAILEPGRRILAECESKRAIVDEFTKAQAGDFSTWLIADEPEYGAGVTAALRNVVQVIALPYAAHPDYDEAWRPES